MKTAIRAGLVLLMAVATFLVWSIRTTIARSDGDPAAIEGLRETIRRLPTELDDGQYTGEPHEMNEQIARTAGADTYTSMMYTDRAGNRFQLYIGGNLGNQENFHAPSYCMPAHGWETLEDTTVPFVAYPASHADPTMRRLRLQYGQQRMLVYYWFQAGAALADHEWWVRIYRSIDLLLGRPLSPTAIITVYVPVVNDEQASEEAAEAFLRAIGPHLRFAFTGEDAGKALSWQAPEKPVAGS